MVAEVFEDTSDRDGGDAEIEDCQEQAGKGHGAGAGEPADEQDDREIEQTVADEGDGGEDGEGAQVLTDMRGFLTNLGAGKLEMLAHQGGEALGDTINGGLKTCFALVDRRIGHGEFHEGATVRSRD